MSKPFHETLPPRLVELVRQAKDQILAAPCAFDVRGWARKNKSCGTTFCIAGHMAILDNPRIAKCRSKAGLDRAIIQWQKDREIWSGNLATAFEILFFEFNWPRKFRPVSPESAALRIDYWLRTGK